MSEEMKLPQEFEPVMQSVLRRSVKVVGRAIPADAGDVGDVVRFFREREKRIRQQLEKQIMGVEDYEEAQAEAAKCEGFADLIESLSAKEMALREALVEATAELIYLRMYGKDGALWYANDSKDVWRAKARAALAQG